MALEALARDPHAGKESEFILDGPQARKANDKLDRTRATLVVNSLLDITSRNPDFAVLLDNMMMMKTAPSKTMWKEDDIQKPTTQKRNAEEEQESRVDPKRRKGNEALLKKLRFIPKGLKFSGASTGKLEKLRRENTQELLQEKKLILILDLDHTLLHSMAISDLTHEEEYLLGDPINESLFIWDAFLTKLRPFVHTFLQEASKMFDMYIYTKGSHPYAMKMAEFLDPQGIYFKSKVISRDDSTVPGMKGLDVVLGEERTMLILDDTQDVWGRHKESLILMEKYHFFASSHRAQGLGGSSLSELKKGEGKFDGALATTLLLLECVHRMFFNSSDNDVREVLLKIRDRVQQGCRVDIGEKFRDEQHGQVDIV